MPRLLNTRLVNLVNLLNDGNYHDGDALGQKLQVSRSAVWKMIKKLQGYGVAIESIKGKGYLLSDPLILLSPEAIQKHLNKKHELKVFESIDSTNTYLQHAQSNQKILFCLAEQQLDGRGRFNRCWHSPFGKNIYLSCRYNFQKDISELSGLSLVTSLAVAKSLKQLGIKNGLGVKWPNDILFDQKKLAGVLIEIKAESHGVSQVVIGIGLNVNELEQQWMSLRKIIGKSLDRNKLAAILIKELILYMELFEFKGLKPFLKEWEAEDCLFGKMIALQILDKQIIGQVDGIDEQGRLALRMVDGGVRVFSSGEASVAKS